VGLRGTVGVAVFRSASAGYQERGPGYTATDLFEELDNMVNDPRDVPDVDGNAIDPPSDDDIDGDDGDDDDTDDEADPTVED
jgi:hypothetical protein